MTSLVDLIKSQHNRSHQIVKYLSERHNITYVSINDWWKGQQHNFEEYIKDWENVLERIDIVYLTNTKISPVIQENINSYFTLRRLINKNSFEIHLNGALTSGYFATKYLLKQGVPSVFDFSDDEVGMIKDSPQIPRILRPIGAKIGKEILTRTINLSKKVVVTTRYLQEKYRIPEKKAVFIPNGVDIDLFRNYGDTKSQLGLESYFVIGYVGVLREWVNFESVYQVLQELPDEIIFLVVGKEGRYNENIELAKRYNVPKKVRFVGNVPYSKVPIYISAMDITLIPFKINSVTEHALPLKVFEYMACEKPVISTHLPTVKDILGENIIYASNSRELKENILRLYNDETLRKTLGKHGRKLVEAEYSWRKLIHNLEKVLIKAKEEL